MSQKCSLYKIMHHILSHQTYRSITYLGKVEPHLFAVETSLVKLESCLGSSQSISETDPDPPKGLEVLELYLGVK